VAALLGLDEMDVIRPVPLTDEEIARQAARARIKPRRDRDPDGHRPKRTRQIGNQIRRP
jgi:hypothetical protein